MSTPLSVAEAEAVLRDALRHVAPDAELEDAGPDDDLAAELDLDSMDILDLVVGVHERTGVDIPEQDYPSIRSRRGFVDYLVTASAGT